MLAYVRAGLRSVRADRFAAKVTVDGEPFFAGLVACVLVGNVGTLKAGVAAFPAASPTDGLLDVGVVTAARPREWAGVMVQTLRKRPDTSAHATVGQGREIDVQFDEQAPLPARRRHEGDDEAPDVQRATGRADTVRSRVLNASTTRANHPHPSASPAMMSVSQWTPSRARLAATATAMSTAPAAERGAADAADVVAEDERHGRPARRRGAGVARRERRAVDLDELTDVGPGAVDDHLDHVHEHELTDPDGGQEERDLDVVVAAVGDDAGRRQCGDDDRGAAEVGDDLQHLDRRRAGVRRNPTRRPRRRARRGRSRARPCRGGGRARAPRRRRRRTTP